MLYLLTGEVFEGLVAKQRIIHILDQQECGLALYDARVLSLPVDLEHLGGRWSGNDMLSNGKRWTDVMVLQVILGCCFMMDSYQVIMLMDVKRDGNSTLTASNHSLNLCPFIYHAPGLS